MMLRELEYESEFELASEFEGEGEFEYESEYEGEFELESEIIGRRDTRVPVSDTRAAPYRYICNLVYNGRPAGSGTLIAPNVVLTAAHVLHDKSTDRHKNPAGMVVIPGRNADRRRGDFRPFGTARAVRFRFAPGYRGRRDNVTRNDYAVAYLRQPIGNVAGHWTIAHTSSPRDPLGTSISAAPLPTPLGVQRVNLSGYPGDKGFDFGTPPQHLRQQWRAYNRAVRERNGMIHYLNDTKGGHSGCPIWVKRDASLGGRVMVGIHLGGDDPTIRGKANQGVRITPTILANIRLWLRGAPPVRRPPTPLPTGPFRVLDRFAHENPNVQPHHEPDIRAVAQRIVSPAPPRVHTVRLVGHADNSGPDAFNLDLGRKRAQQVQAALVAAIDSLRPGHSRAVQMVVQSLGEAKPVAPNTTPEGRARNRRVEVILASR